MSWRGYDIVRHGDNGSVLPCVTPLSQLGKSLPLCTIHFKYLKGSFCVT